MACKQCGSSRVEWDRYIDEDGHTVDAPGDHCEDCLYVMAERSKQRREWNYYHDEPCPEIELTPFKQWQ